MSMKKFAVGLAVAAIGLGIFWSPMFCENMSFELQSERGQLGLCVAAFGALLILSAIAGEYCKRHHID